MKSKIKKAGTSKLLRKHNAYGYLFVSPWIIGLIFLFLVPFIQTIIFSFYQIKITGIGFTLEPVGNKKYLDLFLVHPTFRQVLVSSITKMIVMVPMIVAFSLFAAILINQKFRGRTIVRAIFFLPVIMGSGVIFMLQQYPWLETVLQGTDSISSAMNDMGGSDLLTKYLTEVAGSFNLSLIDKVVEMTSSIRFIIQSSGVQILIFLAGLQSIPASMYESSKIEGATAWEAFWKITLPLVSPIIIVNIVYTVIDSFTNNYNEVMTLIKQTALEGNVDLSASAAMSLVYFAIVAVILVIVTGICSKMVFDQTK